MSAITSAKSKRRRHPIALSQMQHQMIQGTPAPWRRQGARAAAELVFADLLGRKPHVQTLGGEAEDVVVTAESRLKFGVVGAPSL